MIKLDSSTASISRWYKWVISQRSDWSLDRGSGSFSGNLCCGCFLGLLNDTSFCGNFRCCGLDRNSDSRFNRAFFGGGLTRSVVQDSLSRDILFSRSLCGSVSGRCIRDVFCDVFDCWIGNCNKSASCQKFPNSGITYSTVFQSRKHRLFHSPLWRSSRNVAVRISHRD